MYTVWLFVCDCRVELIFDEQLHGMTVDEDVIIMLNFLMSLINHSQASLLKNKTHTLINMHITQKANGIIFALITLTKPQGKHTRTFSLPKHTNVS